MLDPQLQSELNARTGKRHRFCEGGKLADFVRGEIGKKLRLDGKHYGRLQTQLRRATRGSRLAASLSAASLASRRTRNCCVLSATAFFLSSGGGPTFNLKNFF